MCRNALVVPLLLLTLGCGGGGSLVKVHGKLEQNGKPLTPTPKEDDVIDLTLIPVKEGNPPVTAVVDNKDGTFTFPGKQGKGIAPGEYKVVMSYVSYEGENDYWRDQFNLASTPLTYTVTSDPEQEIVIDVAKRSVTKKAGG